MVGVLVEAGCEDAIDVALCVCVRACVCVCVCACVYALGAMMHVCPYGAGRGDSGT
jgi:hypothetical protein